MARNVCVAMAQTLVVGGDAEENLARAVGAVREAGARNCQAVVLPECLDLGWTHPSARVMAEPIPGRHSRVLADAAREAGIWLAAGLVERARDRIYNSAVLFSPSGELVLRHRKLNELTLAHDLYGLGNSVQVVDTELGRVGMLICADLFPDALEYGRALGRMGCQLLLSPCAWAVPADHDNQKEPYGQLWRDAYQQLTAEFPMTMVGVSNVGLLTEGPWKGRRVIGCSLAVGPGGRILAEGPYGETAQDLLVCEAEVSEESLAPVSGLARE